VEALRSGTLCLVRRVHHVVAIETVGRAEQVIEPESLQGFRLQVPEDAFAEQQQIMIKVSVEVMSRSCRFKGHVCP
jgi:hypothetical protein